MIQSSILEANMQSHIFLRALYISSRMTYSTVFLWSDDDFFHNSYHWNYYWIFINHCVWNTQGIHFGRQIKCRKCLQNHYHKNIAFWYDLDDYQVTCFFHNNVLKTFFDTESNQYGLLTENEISVIIWIWSWYQMRRRAEFLISSSRLSILIVTNIILQSLIHLLPFLIRIVQYQNAKDRR